MRSLVALVHLTRSCEIRYVPAGAASQRDAHEDPDELGDEPGLTRVLYTHPAAAEWAGLLTCLLFPLVALVEALMGVPEQGTILF